MSLTKLPYQSFLPITTHIITLSLLEEITGRTPLLLFKLLLFKLLPPLNSFALLPLKLDGLYISTSQENYIIKKIKKINIAINVNIKYINVYKYYNKPKKIRA